MSRAALALSIALVSSPVLAAPPPSSTLTPPPSPPSHSPAEPAPEWRVRWWTLDDGLPVNGLTDIAQTADGFLWIGSSGGLVRFDGQTFVRVDGALGMARITRVENGDDGRLYIATSNLDLFSIGDGQTIEHPIGVNGFDRRSDGLWIGSDDGLWRVGPDGLTRVAHHLGPVVTGLVDRVGRTWLGRRDGLLRDDGSGLAPVLLDGGSAGTVHAMHLADDDRLWIGSSGGLHVFEGDTARRIPLGDGPSLAVLGLHPGTDGMRLSTSRGPWQVIDGVAHPLTPDCKAPMNRHQVTPLRGGEVAACGPDGLYIDGRRAALGVPTAQLETADGLWMVTSTGRLGLVRRPPIARLGGPSAACNAYGLHAPRPGDLWIGCLDREPILIRGGQPVPDRDGHRVAGSIGPTVLEDGDGRLWIADGRLAGRLGMEHVTLLRVDGRGVLWLGGDAGLFRRVGDRIEPVTLPDGGAIPRVTAAHETPDGVLLFASQALGLVRIPPTGSVHVLGTDAGLPTTRIRDIAPASGGGYWLATEDRALVHARLTGARVDATVIGPDDGLFSDHVHRILDDGRGRRWMSSNDGLFWVPERALLDRVAGGARVGSVVYGAAEGLPHREANGGVYPAGLRLPDGRLAFPTQAGVAVLDPLAIERDPRPPRTHIDRVQSGEDPLPPGPRVTLDPHQRDFQVAYTAPVFHQPERVRFRYRLAGFDDDWVEAGTRRQAFYTHVPPGAYRFEVIAANADHVWSASGAAIDIVVRPRFFETWWFAAAAVLAVLALLMGAVRLRFSTLRARARRLEEQVAERTVELARQAEALAALDELKTRFFAHISHELRTPLTLIAGAVDRLPAAADDPQTLDALRRNTHRLRRLTDQILDLLRGDAGLRQVTLEPVDLRALADATVAAFAPMADRRRFAIVGAGNALAHPELVETVLVNLVSNAVKFTADGGRITLRIEPAGERIRLVVEDDGRGIPHADQPHIFDRFYRVESRRLGEGEGTGLGLALARELVHQQAGTLSVDSAPGEGSRFTVELAGATRAPAEHTWGRLGRNEASLLDADEQADALADGPTDRPRVLVVDDNADLRRWIAEILGADYAVGVAIDGQDGLERARTSLPDLIVADVMMPRLDGVGLVEALLAEPETACIPVLLLTARVGADAELRGLRAGAADYLTKPFDVEVLRARVQGILDRRARLRDALRAEYAEKGVPAPAGPAPAGSAPAGSALDVLEAEAPAEPTVVDRVQAVIEARIDDPALDVAALCAAVGMSRSTLARRLADAGAGSPAAMVREIRLVRARALLEAGRGNVSEVAFAVGFNSLAQFSRRFKERFSVPPSRMKSRV